MPDFATAGKVKVLEKRLAFIKDEMKRMILKEFIGNSLKEIEEYLAKEKFSFIDGTCQAISQQIVNYFKKENANNK